MNKQVKSPRDTEPIIVVIEFIIILICYLCVAHLDYLQR